MKAILMLTGIVVGLPLLTIFIIAVLINRDIDKANK